MQILKKLHISGRLVWPVIEGGKGIGISDGKSSGAFAFAGAVGTFSGVNAKLIGKDGIEKPLHYQGKTRNARHEELMEDQKLYCVYVAI